MYRSTLAASALAVAGLLFAAFASAQGQRTFVASYGNDANAATNCTFANPCRSFSTAQGATSAGGEIVALDAAGYGTITVTKSITITANPGVYAGISAASGNAVNVSTASIKVTLRGLNINGTGGIVGVNVDATSGTTVSIENCVVSNFSGGGIFATNANTVRISDSTITGSFHGVSAQGGSTVEIFRSRMNGNTQMGARVSGQFAATTTLVAISDSEASGNNYGLYVTDSSGSGIARLTVTRSTVTHNTSAGVWVEQVGGGLSRVTVSGSLVSGNGYGFIQNSGLFQSQGNNTVRDNATDTSGTITAITGT